MQRNVCKNFGISVAVGEWRSRGGSSPILRFVLGVFVMIGVLVFLGCPIRVILRIAGGDLSGAIALAGFVTGIGRMVRAENRVSVGCDAIEKQLEEGNTAVCKLMRYIFSTQEVDIERILLLTSDS